jgi:hypothetical protein
VSREAHAPFCERPGVRFPRSTLLLDLWFEQEVKPRLRGRATLIRYCDDFIIAFEQEEDARRVMAVLGKRLGRFGLTLHPDKTRLLPFRRPPAGQKGGKGPATFDFLGFTLYWARSRSGRWGMFCKTRSVSLRRAIQSVYDWCRSHRHHPVKAQHAALTTRPLQLLRRQRQLPQLAVARRGGEAGLVQVALPSEPAQASHLGAIRGFASRLPAPPTSDHGSDLGSVATSRISGGAGWWQSPRPDLERARGG